MSSSPRADGMLLSLLLFAGACGSSTARSKDAGVTGGTGAGGAGAAAGAIGDVGGAGATGGVEARDAATSGDATGEVDTGGTGGIGGVDARGTGGIGGVDARGAGGTGGVDTAAVVCEAGTKSCLGSDVLVCSAAGDRWTALESCPGNLWCNKFTTTCTARTICTPNQPLCNGTTATTCNADGTAYASGTECTDTGKICYQGTCAGCWPTIYFCSGATVRHCAADGQSSTLASTCTNAQYCDTATATCKAQVCTPNQPACNGEIATTCRADGSGYAAGGTSCTDTGKFCYQGACVPLACSPSTYFCSGSTLQHCAADGVSSTVSATCASSEYCDSVTAMCKAQVCTPNQAVCNGTIATTCAADGSGYAKGHDCLGSGELCYDGTCHYGPMSSWTFCSGSQVVRCYTDGDCESHATCTSAQYCDSATATCKSLLCTPNQPTCNSNNTPTVCSADGMSYVNDGAPCGSQRCVSGTCQDALFAEDFEDGDLAGWQVSNGAGWSITTTHAAAGTLHGLWGENGSIYQTFAGLKPNRISWWVMAPLDTVESGHFALTSTSGQDRLIATSYFKNDGTLVLVLDTEPVVIPYAANIWYHIELRNFNWTAKTFDYYVNDTLIRAAFPFQATDATSIGRLDLSNPGVVTAYWDQIAFD